MTHQLHEILDIKILGNCHWMRLLHESIALVRRGKCV